MTMINIENVKKARQWVVDEPHFDMQTYGLLVPKEHIEKASETIRKMPMYVESIQFTTMLRNGEEVSQDCGTVCCLAGTVAVRARRPGQKIENLQRFAAKFLGLTGIQAEVLFTSPLYYGKGLEFLRDVTKEKVLARLDEIIEAGCFVWPEYYTFD